MNKKKPLKLIPLAKIVKAHGVKGEVKVLLYNDNSKTLKKDLNVWFNIDDSFISYTLESVRVIDKGSLIKLNPINCRDEVSFLINNELFVSRDDFPKLNDEDKYYLNDLIGMEIIDEKEVKYGNVIDILNLPSNDVLLVKFKDREIMIPNIDGFIELFDFENNIIKVKNIRYLLEL